MDVRFCVSRNHRREAHMRAAGSDINIFAHPSDARVSKSVFSLDDRLTWKSANLEVERASFATDSPREVYSACVRPEQRCKRVEPSNAFIA